MMKQTFVPEEILDKTFEFLQNLGKQKLEAHVLWVGNEENGIFKIKDIVIPQQKNEFVEFEVEPEEVHRINVMINKKGLQLIAQVHTHPSVAFHSNTDDEGAILQLPDSLSIVMPNFGFIDKNNVDKWKVYFFNGNYWQNVDKKEVKELFKIT